MRRDFRDGDRVVLLPHDESVLRYGGGQRDHVGTVLTFRDRPDHNLLLEVGEVTDTDSHYVFYREPSGVRPWPLSAVRLSASTPEGRRERLERIEALAGKLAGRAYPEAIAATAAQDESMRSHFVARMCDLAARVHRAQAIVAAERAS